MSYERVNLADYQTARPAYTSPTWATLHNKVAGHQYTPVDSPYNVPSQPLNTPSQPYLARNPNPFEDNASYSSVPTRQGQSPPRSPPRSIYQLHGVSSGLTGNLWRPGFWVQFPWRGIVALFVTVIATIACIIVLVNSNGVPINQWPGKLQPTVYISICTAIANITLTYALYEGVVIAFWNKVSQGATLRELHEYWHSGSSLWGAFAGIFRFRAKTTALACIMTVLSIGRGPLMQRASSVQNSVVRTGGQMNIFSALRIPEGYAGLDTGRTSTPSLMNPKFSNVLEAYTSKNDIAGTWSGCNSICYANIKGYGFGVSCNETKVPYIMDPILGNGSTTLRPAITVFAADAWQTWANIPSVASSSKYALLLNTTRMGVPTQAWNGSLIQNLCALRAGIVQYPIVISNGTVQLQSSSWRNDTFLEDTGMMALPYNQVSNMAGFILAAKALYYGTASMQFGGGAGWILNLNGASANRYLQQPTSGRNYYYIDANITWRDPMEDMIDSMRELAFRTSLQIAKDNTSYPNASQSVNFIGEESTVIYTANYTYMACAAVLSLMGVVAVLPVYRGFWRLGRPVSLSPIEIAKAFHAPLLNSVSGNRPAEEMFKELGNAKVRYGDSGVIVGENYTSPYDGSTVVKRIGIGPAPAVQPPQKGVLYI